MTTVDPPIGVADAGPRLLQQLNDSDWRVRRDAVAELAERGDKSAVQAVLEALRADHGNLNVASSAIQLLASAGVDAFAALVELLGDPHPELRCCAALTLGLQNNVNAVPALLQALGDHDKNVQYHAIEALGNLRAVAASETLMSIAETRDFSLAFAALEALAKIGDARMAHRLLPMLGDDLLQTSVIDALGSLGGREAIRPLAELLNVAGTPIEVVARNLVRLHDRLNGSGVAELVRSVVHATGVKNVIAPLLKDERHADSAIATVLGWFGSLAADAVLVKLIGRADVMDLFVRKGWVVIDLLVEQISSADFDVRRAAVIALGRIGSEVAVPALLRVLTQDSELSVVAAGALAMIGDRRAYAPLLGLLEWDDPAIRRAAVSALNSLGHPDMAHDMASRLSDPRPHVRESAAHIVGYVGYPELIEALIQHCRDANEGVRKAAVESLPCLDGDPRIIAALSAAAADRADSVRAAAMRTLGKLGVEVSGGLLRRGLADASVWVRYYAARSLAHFQESAALDDLRKLARTDAAVQVRVAALEAIGNLGDAGVMPLLAALTESFENDLARAAIAALGAIGQEAALPILTRLLASSDAGRRLEAIGALSQTKSKDAVPPLAAAARNSDSVIAQAAIDALQRLGRQEAVDVLVALAAAPSLRDACIASLAQCDADQVANGLSHPLLDVRLAVVRSLAQASDSRMLTRGLSDTEGAVRYAALRALADSESPPTRPSLEAFAARDFDPAVRHLARAMLQG